VLLLTVGVDRVYISRLHRLVQLLPFPSRVVLYLDRIYPVRDLQPPRGVAKCIGGFSVVEVKRWTRGGGAAGEETGEEREDKEQEKREKRGQGIGEVWGWF
jgi:hypothetical protein